MKKQLLTILVAICGSNVIYSSELCRYQGEKQRVLVFGGKTGWLGQKIMTLLQQGGHTGVCAESRLENRESVASEIKRVKPDCIINAAGVTGRPNIDWCEDHKSETVRANVIGALNLADVAFEQGVHVTNFGTGCIYTYDDKHPEGSGIGFTEEDYPNYLGSFYSESKAYMQKLLEAYPNVLSLRLRMPLSSDPSPRNFVIKLTKYARVINVPNSIMVVDELLPIAVDMTLRGCKGCYNFVNPGTISHNEVLDLYKKYVDPHFTYRNFTVAEQNKILKAPRSNCELDVTKLLKEYPGILHVKKAVEYSVKRMRK